MATLSRLDPKRLGTSSNRKVPVLVIFCRDPLEPSQADRAFTAELAAVERLALSFVLIDHDALVRGDEPDRVVRRVPEQSQPVLAVYRGWMVTPHAYRVLHHALAARNVQLINDPEQYCHGHYLPENYPIIEGETPRSVWLTGSLEIDRVMEVLASFGDAPVILKDFVKSRKHEWLDACFIPSAADRAAVERVVGRFLELQGEDLAGGLVFREFVEFERVGVHPKSGIPLGNEHRVFWLDGFPVFRSPYWPDGAYGSAEPPMERLSEVASGLRSRFFTTDLARRCDGQWMIVEIGDGQVSGLPSETDAAGFYEALREHWPNSEEPSY